MGNVNSIYEPKERPMRVFVLFSGRASGVRYLLKKDGEFKLDYYDLEEGEIKTT